MVLAGQYLERATLISRRPPGPDDPGLTLEGLYHRGERSPGLVVCAPHPRMGGSMDSAVVAELAWAFTRRGHATLRFNYEGVGASGGLVQAPLPAEEGLSPLLLEAEMGDARAAAEHLAASLRHRRVALAGYSFGAAVALGLSLKEPSYRPLVLVAPPTRLFDFSLLRRLDGPVFIGAGSEDPFVELEQLRTLVEGRANIRLEILEGADHGFTRGLTALGHAASGWLATATQLSSPP